MSGANEDPGDAETGTDVEPAEDGRVDADETDPLADVPEWEDEYLDGVSRRLVYNYDLERDRAVRGESFDLYGRMEVHSSKHVLHPALEVGHHEFYEHLFLRRSPDVSVEELSRLVALGHDLAEEWIDPHEEHYSTEFIFALAVPSIPEDVRSHVEGLDERTLLKYGYNGHYDVHAVVVAPEQEVLVASENADVAEALALWEPIEREEPGILDLIARRLQL